MVMMRSLPATLAALGAAALLLHAAVSAEQRAGAADPTDADSAVIENFPRPHLLMEKEVNVIKVDGAAADDEAAQTVLAPGDHELEVLCTIRQKVGMGHLVQQNSAKLRVRLQGGKTYRVDARVDKDGNCSPFFDGG
jgi:hypothetical protein